MKAANFLKRPGVYASVICIGLCVYAFSRNAECVLVGSYDTGWLAQTGAYILQHGIPTHDIFSFTHPESQFVAYQWLFELITGALFQFGSLWFVGLIACLAAGFLMLFVLPCMWAKKGIPLAVPFFMVALTQTPNWFNARPQLVSYYLILAFLAILERARQNGGRSKWLWLLPLLTVLWANLHSFWIIGLACALVYAICGAIKTRAFQSSLWISFALSCAAVLVNPYGIGLPEYLLTFADGSQWQRIYELLPWWNSSVLPWTLLFIPFAAVPLWMKRNRIPLEGFILSLTFVLLALAMRRFEPVAVLVTWPFLGDALAEFSWATRPQSMRIDWRALAHAACAIGVPVAVWYSTCPTMLSAFMLYTENSAPLLSVVAQHRTEDDRIFTDGPVGSWFIAYGGAPVFADTRMDMYPKQFVADVNDALEAKSNWPDFLNSWQINQIVCRDNYPLNQKLIGSPEWTPVVDDGALCWWIRNSSEAQQQLSQWKLSDAEIERAPLAPYMVTATMQIRAERYLQLARLYRSQMQTGVAMKLVQRGLALAPRATALLREADACRQVAAVSSTN